MNSKLRKKKIFQDLMRSTVPISIDELSVRYDRKQRTIHYDLESLKQELSELGVELQSKSKLGYFIPQNQKIKIPKEMFDIQEGMMDETELEMELFFELLLSEKALSAEVLGQKYFSSASGIQRIIQEMSLTHHSRVSVGARKFRGYYLKGSSDEKLRLACELVTSKFSNYYSIDDFYSLLPLSVQDRISLELCREIDYVIRLQNQHYDIWLTHRNYMNIYFYWILTLIYPQACIDDVDEYSMTEEEKNYIGFMLERIEILIGVKKQSFLIKYLKKYAIFHGRDVGIHEIKKAIQEMVGIVGKAEHYDIKKLAFDIYPHISQSVQRFRNNIEEPPNPLIDQILSKYPQEKMIAREMLEVLNKSMNFPVTDNEISYLILYLYKHRKSNAYNKLRVAVVCATGRGFSNLMEARLANRFPSIDLIKTISAFHHEAFDKDEIDLIVSTVPLKVEDIPIVIVSPILGADDIEKIRRYTDTGDYVSSIPYEKEFPSVANAKDSGDDMANYANIMARITVILLDTLMEFMADYAISQDQMLGLTIHMLMSVERWYKAEEEQFEDAAALYQQLSAEHPKLFSKMELFLASVEELLQCSINLSERLAFFHYIC